MKFVKFVFGGSLIEGIIMAILGLILVLKPAETIMVISNIIGAIVLLIGISSIAKYLKLKNDLDIFSGITSSVLGLILLLNPGTIVSILPLVLGIYFVINGSSKLRYALDIKKYNGNNYLWPLIIAILIIICGTLFIINPFKGAVYIVQIMGIFILTYSILNIINYFTLRKNIKDFKKGFYYDK